MLGLQIDDFMAQGGPIISILFTVACFLWLLIIERYYYFNIEYPRFYDQQVRQWSERQERHSWGAHRIRELLISENDSRLYQWLSAIKVLIAICPLVGLLGTVTGMISVFDIIAITGNSDAKAMASGIYKATLPTMAGLMLALSALYFSHHLQQLAKHHSSHLADQLKTQVGMKKKTAGHSFKGASV